MALTAAKMRDAIKEARGFITKAADLCGVSRTTFYKYLNKYETVKEALEDERESRHDYVETKLMQAIEGNNIAAIIFYLKTQCKARGYVERYQQELTGPDGGPMEIMNVELTETERAAGIDAIFDAARARRDRQDGEAGMAEDSSSVPGTA